MRSHALSWDSIYIEIKHKRVHLLFSHMERASHHRDTPRPAPKPRGRQQGVKPKIKSHPISKTELRSLHLALTRKQAWVKREAKKRLKMTSHFQATSLKTLTAERLDCPICMQSMVDPVLLCCGHSFCQNCIAEAVFRQQQRCPVCRAALQTEELDLFVSPTINQIIKTYYSRLPSEQQRMNYHKRIKEHHTERGEKTIPTKLRVGDQVDCWIEGSWVEAIVSRQAREMVQLAPKQTFPILPHVCLSKHSRRLARLNTYTVRRPSFLAMYLAYSIPAVQPIQSQFFESEPVSDIALEQNLNEGENQPIQPFQNTFITFNEDIFIEQQAEVEEPQPVRFNRSLPSMISMNEEEDIQRDLQPTFTLLSEQSIEFDSFFTF